MFGCDTCCISSFIYLAGVITLAAKVIPFIVRKVKGCKPVELREKAYKKDVVYLFQFPGTPTCSSLSPFSIKIEAFCRLHGIKFERRNTLKHRGQNSLLPFIELNGQVHSDSQIIVRRLTQIFKLKTILGKKKFLLAEEPTAVDCTAFGQIASAYYAIPSARFYFHDLLDSPEFASLKEYTERVKTRIFGDEFCDKK